MFAKYFEEIKHSVCYNGDIRGIGAIEQLKAHCPALNKIMLGRGILENPFLLHELRSETIELTEKKKMMHKFHQKMMQLCNEKYSGDTHFLKSMLEFWSYHALSYSDSHKVFKKVKKSKTFAQYEEVVFTTINNNLR